MTCASSSGWHRASAAMDPHLTSRLVGQTQPRREAISAALLSTSRVRAMTPSTLTRLGLPVVRTSPRPGRTQQHCACTDQARQVF